MQEIGFPTLYAEKTVAFSIKYRTTVSWRLQVYTDTGYVNNESFSFSTLVNDSPMYDIIRDMYLMNRIDSESVLKTANSGFMKKEEADRILAEK